MYRVYVFTKSTHTLLLGLVSMDYCEKTIWCTVAYYELNQRLGEPFHASKSSFIIDGYTSPSDSGRFCLCQISNVNRMEHIKKARESIGKGVRLYCTGGEVFCENLSDRIVFIESVDIASRHGMPPNTVWKVPPSKTFVWATHASTSSETSLKIFSMADFASLLNTAVTSTRYEDILELTKSCYLCISFARGWGLGYSQKTVASTPCWIQACLNGPLNCLDQILSKMSTSLQCTSFS